MLEIHHSHRPGSGHHSEMIQMFKLHLGKMLSMEEISGVTVQTAMGFHSWFKRNSRDPCMNAAVFFAANGNL